MLLAALVPGELRDVLEEGPDDLRLHRLPADPGEPVELPVHFLARLRRQVERGELLLELPQIVPLVVLAQLALNGLELLAEEHLPLPLAQLLLHLGLDVLLGIENADLALHVDQRLPEPLLDAERLQQPLALSRGDVDIPGYQVGELAGLVDAGQHLLNHLVGKPRLLTQLGGPDPCLPMQRHERGIFRIERQHLLGLAHDGLEISLAVAVVDRDPAPLAVQQQLHPRQASLELPDPGDGPDRVEDVGAHALDVLTLGHGEDQSLGSRQRGLDGPERGRPARADRRGDAREQHDLTQRQDRQSQTFTHLGTTPSNSLRGKMAAQAAEPGP